MISARKGEFETGFERGGQTREHAMLVKTAGVKHLIVVINKMDDPTVMWSIDRYESNKNLFESACEARRLFAIICIGFLANHRLCKHPQYQQVRVYQCLFTTFKYFSLHLLHSCIFEFFKTILKH